MRDNGQSLEIPCAEHGNFPEYFHERTGVKPSPKVGMMDRSQVRDCWPTGNTGADGSGAVLVAKALSRLGGDPMGARVGENAAPLPPDSATIVGNLITNLVP